MGEGLLWGKKSSPELMLPPSNDHLPFQVSHLLKLSGIVFYDPVPENTALYVFSLEADADWEGGPLKRSYKILKEIRTGIVEFATKTNT